MLFELPKLMWNNYIILMIRSYKSWSGFFIATLLGIVAALSLTILLIRILLSNYNLALLIIVILIVIVTTIAFANYTTLRLKKRVKEFYLRKLLGARDSQLQLQLLMESIVLSGFVVVSGLVLAEIISPFGGKVLGVDFTSVSFYIWQQVLIIILLVLPIGLLGSYFPIRGIIKYVKKDFTKLSHKKF